MNRRTGVISSYSCSILLFSCVAAAQVAPVSTPPPNIVIGNYNSTAVGPYGGLEGSAYAARVNDPSAAWFNPAGLTRQGAPQISGSAGVYQRTAVAPEALDNAGGSLQQLPNFVGFTFVPRDGVTIGAAFLSTNAWAQQTDAELFGGDEPHRFTYSADSGFEQRVAALSAGIHRGGPWRFGGGLAFSLMDLRMVQGVSDRMTDGASLRTLLVESHSSASALQLRAQGGAQYDVDRWRLGMAVRTPGLSLHSSGAAVFEGVYAGDPGTVGTSFFDANAAAEYHLPWEFQGGAALVAERFEFEIDLHAFTGIGPYLLLTSEQPVRVYTDPGPGAPPAMTTSSFPGPVVATTSVVNVGAGGHVRVLKNRDLRIHAGIGTNRSPVAPEDTLFTKVDLVAWSIGASGSLGKFQFAIGLNRHSGTADDITLRNLLDGRQVTTPVSVRMAGLIYSLAYQF